MDQVISDSDIQRAWDTRMSMTGQLPAWRYGIETALEKMGICACKTCGGTGHLAEENEDGTLKYATGGMPIICDCKECYGRGWSRDG